MDEQRSRVLDNVRKALGREQSLDADSVRNAHAQDVEQTKPPRPLWGEPVREHFLAGVREAAATSDEIAELAALPDALARFLDSHELARELTVAPHPLLSGLTWPESWTVTRGAPAHDALVGLSVAYAGVAETGTLALYSGPQSPITLNYLSDFHVVLVPAERIVPYFEDLWQMTRQEPSFPPRAINLITGPSRTADIEQTIQLGAHGPRKLHVIVVG